MFSIDRPWDTDMADEPADVILNITARIVSAHVHHNAVPADQLPGLIRSVHGALARAANGPEVQPTPTAAVSAKQSMTANQMICMDCGKTFTSLKRHLRSAHGLSPNQYRMRWKLPRAYPMVAPNYAKKRSAWAKKAGLGGAEVVAPGKAGSGRG